jgi:hypothetical protein
VFVLCYKETDLIDALFHRCAAVAVFHIELTGTLSDWRLFRDKAAQLRRNSGSDVARVGAKANAQLAHLNVWLDELLPVLDHVVEAAAGNPISAIFGGMCSLSGGSMPRGEAMTG